MNAYELAGRLLEKKLYLIQEGVNSSYLENAANMLRQQADRIAELDKEMENLKAGLLSHNDIYSAKDESFDRTASHMANEYVSHYEPTAWINHIKQTGGDFYELNVSGRGEPLYRHPPQTKPLSDKEIMYETFRAGLTISKDTDVFLLEHDVEALVNFARAIEAKVRGQ